MGVFCTWLGFNEYLFKIIAAVLVVVLNYFISKLLVFRKTKRETAAETASERES
jgi:putative flippase GtrA